MELAIRFEVGLLELGIDGFEEKVRLAVFGEFFGEDFDTAFSAGINEDFGARSVDIGFDRFPFWGCVDFEGNRVCERGERQETEDKTE